jgi:fructose-bisphosphate aldolase, class II
MKSLLQTIQSSEEGHVAVGHFNIANLEMLKAITEISAELELSVIIGVSEGEREYVGVRQSVDLIKSYNEEYADRDGVRFFLNADHTHSLEKVEEAARAGFDAVLFDGGKLPFDENIFQTKRAVEIAKSANPDVLVEGELGYIGGSSKLLDEIPEGAEIKDDDLTTPEEAAQFIKETGVDMLAPAVGNLHGMFKNAPNPRLNIQRIRDIKKAVLMPLVLHGGSGIADEDFQEGIKAGISIVHISTEIRRAWREGFDKALGENKEEIAPYKLTPAALGAIKGVVRNRLKLFNNLL